MADDITLNAGSGGDTLAADDIGGVKYTRSKITLGADNTNDGDVSSSNPMPVAGTAAENAAAAGAPVPAGGRYDATPRTLGDGDRGEVALAADGAVHIDDGGNSITVDSGDLSTLAGAVSGSEMQVDVVAALPAGTNAIGKLAANDGVDIGDVDVTSVVPGTGATNLGKAEDAAHTTGDVGVMGLTVRQDTAAALSGTDADYQPFITDASGRLHVNVGTSALPSGAATETTLDAVKTAVELIDNAISGSEMQVDIVSAGGVATETTLDAIKTAVEILDNIVSGSEAQVDVVAALPAGTNAIGLVGHDITGIGHGVKTVTTAGTDVVLSTSQAAKGVIVQSQTDNTGLIAVGASGVDATEATGTGVILYPGDSVFVPCDNLDNIYIDSTVNGEGVRYTYFT